MRFCDLEKTFLWSLLIAFIVFIIFCLAAFGKHVVVDKKPEVKTCEEYSVQNYLHGDIPQSCLTKMEEVLTKVKVDK